MVDFFLISEEALGRYGLWLLVVNTLGPSY